MKVVIPNFVGPDTFVDNVTSTLRRMGHEVLTRGPRSNRHLNSPLRQLEQIARRKLRLNEPDEHERWLIETVRSTRPDLVLVLTQQVQEEALKECRRAGVRHIVAWWGDTVGNMREMGLLSDAWDRIYLKDPHGVEKFRRLGLPAELLHEAMNPEWHRPIASQANNSIVVAGSFYGYRQALVSRLIDRDVELGLYGGRLPRWGDRRIAQLHSGRFIEKQEKSRVFGEALGCLNSTALNEGNSLNCRAFEIAGAGGLQLLEHRAITSECFEPGEEILLFTTIDELLELISRAGRDSAWAARIREAGSNRAHRDHTYDKRLAHILARLRTA